MTSRARLHINNYIKLICKIFNFKFNTLFSKCKLQQHHRLNENQKNYFRASSSVRYLYAWVQNAINVFPRGGYEKY